MSFRCHWVIVVFAVLAAACSSSTTSSSTQTDAGQAAQDVASAIDTAIDSASSVDSVSSVDTTEPVDTIVDAGPQVPTCVATGAPGKDFDQSATGSDPYEKVGDFTISSLDGPVTLSKLWTGCDGHMFVIYHPDSKYASYAGAIWNSNPNVVFNQAPKDTHWYFLSYSSGDQAKQDVSIQRDKWLDALSKLSDEEQSHWKPRLHFIPVNAWQLPGWIGQTLKKKAVFHFGIDALQRRREIGLARPPMGNQPGNLRHLMFETQWYAWELKTRHQIDTLPDKKTVTIFDQVPVQSGWGGKKKFVDVEMPSAEELAQYDGAHLEIAHGCDGGLDSNCPDWDRETSLFVCDVPKGDTEPAPMACVATETQDCSCLGADGKTRTAKRKCNKDLSGFGACNC
ncbi:MAG: hypothetical protein CMH53_08510, partial [Myxococcales bacterium]|nr:hypothetical protein [Myxococcales bacterium]